MDQDPIKHQAAQERQAQWEISKGRSLLATAALNGALLASGALPHGELADFHRTKTEYVQEVVVDEVTGQAASTQEVEMPFTTIDKLSERWARQFANDPHAGELLDESETTRVATGIKELLDTNDDCRIDAIELTGQASDDDDSTNENGVRTAGLGELDADGENVELAEERSTVFEEKLRAELAALGVDTSQLPIVQMPGVEDLMSTDEISQVDAFVQQFGYSSRAKLIEQYNRTPDRVPPAAAEFLDQALKSERTVTVAIKGTCIDQVQTTVKTTEFVETVQRKEVQKEIEISIPWFMIIPVPVPRRNKDEADNTVTRPRPLPVTGGSGRVPAVPIASTVAEVTPTQPVRPAHGGRGRARKSHRPPAAPSHVRGPKDRDYKLQDDRKYTGPDRGPKRYVGPNVHGGYWHV